MTEALGDRIQIVGDDLFVTNTERPPLRDRHGQAGNSILIKVNQIGTLTETLQAIEMAHKAGYTAIISIARERRRTPPFPRSRSQQTQDRSRPGPPAGPKEWPSTISCCGSKSRSDPQPATTARRSGVSRQR